jgi:hypothetical protein
MANEDKENFMVRGKFEISRDELPKEMHWNHHIFILITIQGIKPGGTLHHSGGKIDDLVAARAEQTSQER